MVDWQLSRQVSDGYDQIAGLSLELIEVRVITDKVMVSSESQEKYF